MTVAGMAQVDISPLTCNIILSLSLSLPRPPSSYLPSVVATLSLIILLDHKRFAHSGKVLQARGSDLS